ncbi:MAG: hypothetical protein DMG13_12080 [Acidobacteria bacterium]|nr:MAG: hypothetical protein DMG13_12080 [Acidobacteriota bacterium]
MGERRSAIIIGTTIVVLVGLVLLWALLPSAQDRVSGPPLTEITDTSRIQDHIQIPPVKTS